MPATLTYSPLLPQKPADCLRKNTRRYAQYAETHPVQPLKGLRETRAAYVSYRAFVPAGHAGCGLALSYRALAPGGAGFCYRICTGTSESRLTAHYSLLTANSTYTFSAKEKDSETGLSYFGSRYYNSDLSIWLSVDPMADKYPSMSSYVYCANNPVKLVDPNGEDIWEINEEGRIINHDKSFTEKDIVYRVDNNGNRIEGEFVAFDYGTIEQQKSITYSPDGKTVDTYDMYQVRGDDNGTKLFEFIAQTVSGAGIEVSQIQCGEEGKNGLNFITCSHEKPHDEVRNGNTYTVSSEKSGWLVFSGRLQYGYTIRAWNHSHPSSTNASEADMSLKASANKILQDSGRACPQYNIYHVPSKKTIPY